jgi:hypothetical protein
MPKRKMNDMSGDVTFAPEPRDASDVTVTSSDGHVFLLGVPSE